MENHSEAKIQDKLVSFVSKNFMVEPEEINLEESLVDQGVIDSIGLPECSAFMEQEFGIKIADEDMTRANFGSIKKMTAFVLNCLQ